MKSSKIKNELIVLVLQFGNKQNGAHPLAPSNTESGKGFDLGSLKGLEVEAKFVGMMGYFHSTKKFEKIRIMDGGFVGPLLDQIREANRVYENRNLFGSLLFVPVMARKFREPKEGDDQVEIILAEFPVPSQEIIDLYGYVANMAALSTGIDNCLIVCHDECWDIPLEGTVFKGEIPLVNFDYINVVSKKDKDGGMKKEFHFKTFGPFVDRGLLDEKPQWIFNSATELLEVKGNKAREVTSKAAFDRELLFEKRAAERSKKDKKKEVVKLPKMIIPPSVDKPVEELATI